MRYCKKCVMPDTRPGIFFNDEGVCQGCLAEEKKIHTNWDARWKELEALCDRHRGRNNGSGFDCVIAVSGGKDSHFQTHILKEKLGMNPLLVTVEDNYSKTMAGVNNLRNISEVYGCNIVSIKPDVRADKIVSKNAFRKYGRPTWILEKLIYTFPVKIALAFNISLVVYGEDVGYIYGGKDACEKASALTQIENGVAADIPFGELLSDGLVENDLHLCTYPMADAARLLEPIYLSYFMPWNSYFNYVFSKSIGFRDITHEWHRENIFEHFDQIDSIGYLVNGFLKYAKYGHGMNSDYVSRFIRYGLMSREEGITLVKKYDNKIDQRCVDDFCDFVEIKHREFYRILDTFYNRDIFTKNSFGEWELKKPIWSDVTVCKDKVAGMVDYLSRMKLNDSEPVAQLVF